MSKIKQQDNDANMQNANKGQQGVNKQYAQVHGNRSKQIAQHKQNNEKNSGS